jgi:NADH:ubiquinone oxidoreductase subunit F (NADH-binding)
MTLIDKIEQANLTGRGGAGFPVATKWRAVLTAGAKTDKPVYVICNATEGEPGVTKDKFLLEFHPEEVVKGILLALKELKAKKAIIYCQKKDLKKIKTRLARFIKKSPIEFFSEDGGYLCGEETTLIETIEGNRSEPRLKPPFPTEKGLFDGPTLVNNVETFYAVAKIAKGEYKNTRFVSISGEIKNPGVFEVPEKLSLDKILSQTKNEPRGKFFLQVGGGAAGTILTPDELGAPLRGAGSIIVHSLAKTKPRELMKKWIEFFYGSNCGKCAPCREGVYRVRGELKKQKPNWLMMRAILETMRDTSFCPLGKSVHEPMISLMEKVDIK